MKSITRFLLVAMALIPFGANASPVPTTAGNNLTAYNPNGGSLNNNTWATATNSRSNATPAPKADFGNCNSLIMRCAQPKCSGGGCADMTVASTIVNGCVQSSDVCKKHGTDLVNYIAAQLVADSAAAANAAAANAANAAAAQNAQQMAAMQQQMQQMQADMAAQNTAQMQQMQAALDEQKRIAAEAQAQAAAQAEANAKAQANAVATGAELSMAQKEAAAAGVSQELLLRETAGGEIMTMVENAEKQLSELKKTMDATFEYAGCDSMGNNCSGPKRVSKFRDMANAFFTPYENVVDEVYDGLIMATTIGVDMTDIMMLLNNSCNVWGEFWCGPGQEPTYTAKTCPKDKNISQGDPNGTCGEDKEKCHVGPYGGFKCTVGARIPEADNGCRMVKTYPAGKDVSRAMLYGEESGGANGDTIRVACASDALAAAPIFAKKAKNTMIDVDTLQRIINQKEGRAVRGKKPEDALLNTKMCAVSDAMYIELQKYVAQRSLPNKRLCINENRLDRDFNNMVPLIDATGLDRMEKAKEQCAKNYGAGALFSELTMTCYCSEKNNKGKKDTRPECDEDKTKAEVNRAHQKRCESYYTSNWTGSADSLGSDKCVCDARDKDDTETVKMCEEMKKDTSWTVHNVKGLPGYIAPKEEQKCGNGQYYNSDKNQCEYANLLEDVMVIAEKKNV